MGARDAPEAAPPDDWEALPLPTEAASSRGTSLLEEQLARQRKAAAARHPGPRPGAGSETGSVRLAPQLKWRQREPLPLPTPGRQAPAARPQLPPTQLAAAVGPSAALKAAGHKLPSAARTAAPATAETALDAAPPPAPGQATAHPRQQSAKQPSGPSHRQLFPPGPRSQKQQQSLLHGAPLLALPRPPPPLRQQHRQGGQGRQHLPNQMPQPADGKWSAFLAPPQPPAGPSPKQRQQEQQRQQLVTAAPPGAQRGDGSRLPAQHSTRSCNRSGNSAGSRGSHARSSAGSSTTAAHASTASSRAGSSPASAGQHGLDVWRPGTPQASDPQPERRQEQLQQGSPPCSPPRSPPQPALRSQPQPPQLPRSLPQAPQWELARPVQPARSSRWSAFVVPVGGDGTAGRRGEPGSLSSPATQPGLPSSRQNPAMNPPLPEAAEAAAVAVALDQPEAFAPAAADTPAAQTAAPFAAPLAPAAAQHPRGLLPFLLPAVWSAEVPSSTAHPHSPPTASCEGAPLSLTTPAEPAAAAAGSGNGTGGSACCAAGQAGSAPVLSLEALADTLASSALADWERLLSPQRPHAAAQQAQHSADLDAVLSQLEQPQQAAKQAANLEWSAWAEPEPSGSQQAAAAPESWEELQPAPASPAAASSQPASSSSATPAVAAPAAAPSGPSQQQLVVRHAAAAAEQHAALTLVQHGRQRAQKQLQTSLPNEAAATHARQPASWAQAVASDGSSQTLPLPPAQAHALRAQAASSEAHEAAASSQAASAAAAAEASAAVLAAAAVAAPQPERVPLPRLLLTQQLPGETTVVVPATAAAADAAQPQRDGHQRRDPEQQPMQQQLDAGVPAAPAALQLDPWGAEAEAPLLPVEAAQEAPEDWEQLAVEEPAPPLRHLLASTTSSGRSRTPVTGSGSGAQPSEAAAATTAPDPANDAASDDADLQHLLQHLLPSSSVQPAVTAAGVQPAVATASVQPNNAAANLPVPLPLDVASAAPQPPTSVCSGVAAGGRPAGAEQGAAAASAAAAAGSEEQHECCVCLEDQLAPAAMAVCVPCGHQAMCRKCLPSYMAWNLRKGGGCPKCRHPLAGCQLGGCFVPSLPQNWGALGC